MSSSQCKSPKTLLTQVSSETVVNADDVWPCCSVLVSSTVELVTRRALSILLCIIGVYVSRKCEGRLPKSQGSYTYGLTKNSCIWFNNFFLIVSRLFLSRSD